MSGIRAIQQIGSLLSQSGVPSGISLDISQRLMTATGLGGSNSRSNRSLALSDYFSRSPDFYNAFKPPEQDFRGSKGGLGGKDGGGNGGTSGKNGLIYGFYIPGKDGKDGEGGRGGDGGRGGNATVSIGPIPPIFIPGPKPEEKKDEEKKEDCCDELRQKIKTLEKNINDLAKKVRQIEKKLENTVEC